MESFEVGGKTVTNNLNNKYIVHVSKTKKVILKFKEISVLRQVLIHEVVPSRVIHDLFRAFVDNGISSSVISNRLRKFVETDILVKIDEPISFNNTVQNRSYYKLGHRGLGKLFELNKFEGYEYDEICIRNSVKKVPSTTELAASIIANEILVKTYLADEWIDHSKAEHHTLLRNNRSLYPLLEKKNLLPSWIFEDNDRVICLVINPKTIIWNDLEKALRLYNNLAKEAESENKEFLLFFSFIDVSLNILHSSKVEDVKEKVLNFKSIFPSFKLWQENLSVYALTATRTADCVYKIIINETLEDNLEDGLPESMDVHLNNINIREFHHQRIGEEQPQSFVFHELHRLWFKEEQRHIAVIFGNEGSVLTFQKINFLSHYLNKNSYRFNRNPISLWVIYQDKQRQKEDILMPFYDIQLWLTNYTTWENRGIFNFQFPMMDKLIGRNRMKESLYYNTKDNRYEEDFKEVYIPSDYLKTVLYSHYYPLVAIKRKWKRERILGNWMWKPRTLEEQERRFDAVAEIFVVSGTIQCLMIQEDQEEDATELVKSSLDLIQKKKTTENGQGVHFEGFPLNKNQMVIIFLPFQRTSHYYQKIDLRKYDFPILFLEKNKENPISSIYRRKFKTIGNHIGMKIIHEDGLQQWLEEKYFSSL